MSERDLPPWPDDLQSLLAAERRGPSPSAASLAARARIFQHVEAILGPALDLPPGGPHAPAQPAPDATPQARHPHAPQPAAPLAPAAKAVAVKAAAGKMLALAFTAGALAGVGGYAGAQRMLAKPAAPIAAPMPVAPSLPAAPIASEPQQAHPPSPVDTPPGNGPAPAKAAHEAKPAQPPARTPRADSEERTLVETARTALQRGDAAGALAILDRLRKEHAQSEFGEEAQALRVMSLAGLSRAGEARREAAAFHREHPESLLGQAVDASVAGLPAE